MRKVFMVLIFLSILSTSTALNFGTQKAAYIELSGTISSSGPGTAFSSTGITPGEVRNFNDKVKQQGYQAVIYEINSGGGTVVASKEIMREIDSMNVPTVCRFRDVAASGAYLFSLGCDEIVADKASMTGSIGVRSSYLEFSQALEKYGIEYVNISAGEFKGVGSPYMNTTQQDKEILSQQASQVHDQFLELVKKERNLTDSEISEVGQGQVILGEEAKSKGLVDHLGGRQKAENTVENITNQDLSFESLQKTESFNLFSLLSMNALNSLIGSFSGPESPLTAKL